MSTNPSHHPAPAEFSGEHVLFAMAIAFGVVMVAIVAGAFMPVAAGVAMIFGVLGVVLVLVGIFLARLLGEG
jgi:hypothetical protein